MFLIPVSERTSPQRAAAIRARLMNPPRRALPAPAIKPIVQSPPERLWPVQHDYHVSTRATYLLAEMTGRIMAVPIIKEMCRAYGVTYEDICSNRRTQPLTFIRQKMQWVVKKRTTFSYPRIGQTFGGRDHTSVFHAVRKIDGLVAAGSPDVADLAEWVS